MKFIFLFNKKYCVLASVLFELLNLPYVNRKKKLNRYFSGKGEQFNNVSDVHYSPFSFNNHETLMKEN